MFSIGEIIFILLSCAFFMALVAVVSYYMTKGHVSTADEYFLAGRGLTGVFIAGSLLLTNLSAEQLIGLNGQSFTNNMSGMAWEVTAGLAAIIMAIFLLPKFLGIGISTIPEFLSKRYDETVRRLTVILFLLGYMCVTIPSMLYSGGVSVLQLFDLPELLDITYTQALWLTVWFVGIVGAVYAIFGGLRAVAVSDTLNGIGLVIIGFLVPILGFILLGNGNMVDGMKHIVQNSPEKLNAIGSSTDNVPFFSIFTGILFANLFYWALNQYVIQRALGAKNLAEGQKGVLYTGYLKLLVPIFMLIPGVIAYHLYGDSIQNGDLSYPTLVSDVLPVWMLGFFLAVLFGAVLSSFNSILNSVATLLVLDIYQPVFEPDASDEKLIKVSKILGIIIALVSFFVAPFLMYAPDGLWNLIRQFTGFFNIPILVIVLMGMIFKRVPASAAKVVIIFHVVAYYMMVWGFRQIFDWDPGINYIHIYGILLAIEVVFMLIMAKIKPLKVIKPVFYAENGEDHLVPWKHAIPVSITLIFSIVIFYVIFSPIGLAYEEAAVSNWFWPVIAILIAANVVLYIVSIKTWHRKYHNYVEKQTETSRKTRLSGD
ncbi:solute:sodium symporter family transporter [Virgibacillus sp. 7505]|uniref:solute:sodium symporter family transporter n=1 Tax=Virgibacillus sp. 7505 TaxID=2022548 RepID=UPI000BA53085|nr:solute:sodium symporter family transporter [Virgibacillus sp. 7505]PAE17800.1 solute:sodium symporter family transporter [Virgibacillus sp. 7505]